MTEKKSKKKVMVLDTNILFDDSSAHSRFKDNIVVVPGEVISELNKYKSENSDRGRHARLFARARNQLAEQGSILTGVIVNNEGGIYKETDTHITNATKLDYAPGIGDNDLNILRCAKQMQIAHPELDVELVSNDIFVLGTAKANGIKAKMRLADAVDLQKVYTGQIFIEDEELLALMYNPDDLDEGRIPVDKLSRKNKKMPSFELFPSSKLGEKFEIRDGSVLREDFFRSLVPNQYVVFTNPKELFEKVESPSFEELKTAFRFVVDVEGKKYLKPVDIQKLRSFTSSVKIKPKNLEQCLSLDLCLADDVSIVTLYGPAGTGKTLIATASAWYLTKKEHMSRILLTKPHQNVGQEEYGFLPGNIDEKVIMNYASVDSAFQTILESKEEQQTYGKGLSDLLQDPANAITMRPLGYLRGANIRKGEVLLGEEMQNTTQMTIKTLVTRKNKGSKIFLTGDPEQIDHPRLRPESNGLTHLVEAIQSSKYDARLARNLASFRMINVQRDEVVEWALKYL